MKLLAHQRELQAKIPDIEKCLDVVATLEAKKAAGEILKCLEAFIRMLESKTDSVCLWLVANVMLEYSYEEANSLLQKNLENAKSSSEVLVKVLNGSNNSYSGNHSASLLLGCTSKKSTTNCYARGLIEETLLALK